jgi:hypothetical protein
MRKAGSPSTRRAWVIGSVLLCCCFLSAMSGTAIAGGELFEIQGDQFALAGSHGYEITVVGYLGGKPRVTLYAKRGHSEVEYTAPGTVTEEDLSARFGSLGSVDVHFEPSGQVREEINYCDSSHPTVAVKLGTFVGTIDFRGERGYTSVQASRAQGGVGNDLALPGEPEDAACQSLSVGGEVVQKAQFTSLQAAAPKSHIGFSAIATTEVEGEEASSSSSTSHVFLAADSITKEKKMEIRRLVATEGAASDFAFDAGLDSAVLTPPAPFSGTARFRKGAGGKSSWTGTLKVPIPGLGTVRLAGPGFRARFERTNGTLIH